MGYYGIHDGEYAYDETNKKYMYISELPEYYTTFIIESQGDGSGVGRFNYLGATGEDVIMTVDGDAKFYDDEDATEGESSSKTIPAGTTTFTTYIKVTSGSSNLKFSQKDAFVRFGRVTTATSGSSGFGYVSSASNSPKLTLNNWDFPNCTEFGFFSSTVVTMSTSLSNLSSSFEKIYISSGTITGDVSDIPAVCTIISITSASISGNISDIPSGMQYIRLADGNTITGDIANFPDSIISINISGSNTLSGTLSSLNNPNLIDIDITGNNTISGDIADISTGLESLTIRGSNTISGDVADMPDGTLTSLTLFGSNTIEGDIADLPQSLTTMYIFGSNTLNGDIKDISTGVTSCQIGGNNTISGDINNIPSDNLTQLVMAGGNTISGTLDTSLYNSSLTYMSIGGDNTLTGDVANLPQNCRYILIGGNNTINAYTGKTWPNNLYYLYINPVSPGGLDSTEIDNLLIDLADDVTVNGNSIVLQGENAAPTAASSDARDTLEGLGFELYLNS